MNKKGFTIVEIIICISIVLIVGISTTFFIFNNKNNKELESITKEILEAANLYASTEKDEEGKIYLNEVRKDKKGIKIPLNNLVSKGYIKEEIKNEVIQLSNKGNDYNYYVMLLDGSVESIDYCNDGSILSLASWIDSDNNKDVYLCDNSIKKDNIIEMNKKVNFKVNLDKFAVSTEYYETLTEEEKVNFTDQENGIFQYYSENTQVLYSYYRGSVTNNFIKLGQTQDGNPLYWRILWYNDKNKMKIILDDTIPMEITNSDGEVFEITPDKNTLITYEWNSGWASHGLITYMKHTNLSTTSNIINVPYYFRDGDHLKDPSNNLYKTRLNEWYSTTDLSKFSFITKTNNFCTNSCYKGDSSGLNNYYQVSNNFECAVGIATSKGSTSGCTFKESTESSVVGYLNYGELMRAGIPSSSSISLLNSGNFLINNSKSILLSDLQHKVNWAEVFEYKMYYFGANGLKYGTMYKQRYDSNISGQYSFQLNGVEFAKQGIDSDYLSYFLADALKPAIILDLTNIKLSDADGTKNNPYELIEKNG